MIAYFVHDKEKEEDRIVLPEMGCSVAVDGQKMQSFIGVSPEFAAWSGNSCADMAPEDFGTVIATRSQDGDVCVLDTSLWQTRMQHHLGTVQPEYERTAQS